MNADTCEPHISDAGLPRRDAMLERERSLYAEMVSRLGGESDRSRGATPSTPEHPLTAQRLTQSLASSDTIVAAAAAFLVGRVRCVDAAADEALLSALRVVLTSDAEGAVRSEAAMSLVVRGEREVGQEALRAIARSTNPFDEGYNAAAYLTQLDDPSGWTAITRAASSELGHYRLMALRRAPLFTPWRGTQVGSEPVDPAALLRSRADDPSELVRRELPMLLEAVGIEDAERAVLEALSSDPSTDVRRLATEVLERQR